MTLCVAIYMFPEVEILDFAGPYEVFTTAARVAQRTQQAAAPPFRVFTISQRAGIVSARAGLKVTPDYTFSNHPPIDLLVVPGGVVTGELESAAVIAWIKATAASARITASICTGAFLLAKAGLLHGKAATTHWEDIPDLRAMFASISVLEQLRWVDEGRIITSAGISAGIDMSLHLVERLAGQELALKTARQMEFDWHTHTGTRG